MADFAEQLVMSEPVVPEQTAPAPEPQPAAAPAPVSDDRPRNADGTFANKVKDEGSGQGVKQEAVQQPAAPAISEPPTDTDSPHVPRTALLDERRKRQALEAELAELRKPKPEQQPQQPTQPQTTTGSKAPNISVEIPDYEDDPQAHFDARLLQNKLDTSTYMAAQQFGEAVVGEAWAAFDQAARTDPRVNALAASLTGHPHPMGEVISWYRQQKEITQLSEAGGLEKLRERMRAELLAEMGGQQPAPVAAAASGPAAIPMPKPAPVVLEPSLAKGGAGSNSAPEGMSDAEVFGKIFDKSQRQSRKR